MQQLQYQMIPDVMPHPGARRASASWMSPFQRRAILAERNNAKVVQARIRAANGPLMRTIEELQNKLLATMQRETELRNRLGSQAKTMRKLWVESGPLTTKTKRLVALSVMCFILALPAQAEAPSTYAEWADEHPRLAKGLHGANVAWHCTGIPWFCRKTGITQTGVAAFHGYCVIGRASARSGFTDAVNMTGAVANNANPFVFAFTRGR